MKKFVCILISSFAISFCFAGTDSCGVTAKDKAFFQKLQKAVLNDDFEWFSAAVSYPIDLHYQNKTDHIKTKAELKRHAAFIFSPHNKEIIKSQSADALFKNWQGTMIGRGEFWFEQFGETQKKSGKTMWVYHVLTVNDVSEAPR